MNYTPITLADNAYEVQEEARKGGFEDLIGIVQPENVTTYPTFSVETQKATGAFVFASGKKPTAIKCIIEAISGETKGMGRAALESDFKITLQNTAENRALYNKLGKIRFTAYLKECEGDGLLLGKPGVTTGYLAHIKDDSYSDKRGGKFNDARTIEFIITAKPYGPYEYTENFSFAAGS